MATRERSIDSMYSVDSNNLIKCPICEATNVDKKRDNICRRCGSKIYHHRNNPTEKSWAFLITAIIFYIPANIYPMMIVDQFGEKFDSTIIGGVIELWDHGDYPISAIIFVASIFVPITKFLMIIYLLVSAKYSIGYDKRVNKFTIYYFTELIGPWSMVDVFVVGILAGLVHLSSVKIIAGTASTAFALSVFFTLLSAHTFDTKLIKENH
jgi:paraquat-inducible protein A